MLTSSKQKSFAGSTPSLVHSAAFLDVQLWCCNNTTTHVWLYSLSPFCTCPNIIAFQVTTSRDGNLLNSLWASSMLPHFTYMSVNQATTPASHPLWMICSWAHLRSSSSLQLLR
jgi:hypothetical protein